MDSEQRSRADHMEASNRAVVAASNDLMRRTGGRPEDALAINALMLAVRRQAHAVMITTPLSGVEAGVRDRVAGQIYHDPNDPRPCFRCGGSGTDPWFSDPGGPDEPPYLEPCVACYTGEDQSPAAAFPDRVRMNHTIHAAQPWPDDPAQGAPLTACRSTIYQRDWYGDRDTMVICGPCRQVIGQDGISDLHVRCPDCGHHICDGIGPCGAIVGVSAISDTKRCQCTTGRQVIRQDGGS